MPQRTFFIRGGRDAAPVVTEMLSGFTKAMKGMKEAARDAAEEAGNAILDNTLPHVPVDTTALRESGKVTVTEKGDDVRVEVSFGGETPIIDRNSPNGIVDYALVVHENMGVDHEEGEPQYLALGVSESFDEVREIINRHLKNALNEAGR